MPLASSLKSHAVLVTRSMRPQKLDSEPMGTWAATALAPRRSFMVSMAWKKSAPTRSYLLLHLSLSLSFFAFTDFSQAVTAGMFLSIRWNLSAFSTAMSKSRVPILSRHSFRVVRSSIWPRRSKSMRESCREETSFSFAGSSSAIFRRRRTVVSEKPVRFTIVWTLWPMSSIIWNPWACS